MALVWRGVAPRSSLVAPLTIIAERRLPITCVALVALLALSVVSGASVVVAEGTRADASASKQNAASTTNGVTAPSSLQPGGQQQQQQEMRSPRRPEDSSPAASELRTDAEAEVGTGKPLQAAVVESPSSPPLQQSSSSSPQAAARAALELARAAQERADDTARALHEQVSKVRAAYRAHVARAVTHRNRLLRRVPQFWYDALLGLPRYDAFLSVPQSESAATVAAAAAEAASASGGYEDPAAAAVRAWRESQQSNPESAAADMAHPNNVDDHYILRHFLEDVRCFLVRSGDRVTRSELDKFVAEGAAGGDDDENDDDRTLPADFARPSFDDSGAPLPPSSSGYEEMYRVVLTFRRNPYFADRYLYKQVPASQAHMLATSDEEALAAEGRGIALGQGNSLSWSTKRARVAHLKENEQSIFAIFDDDFYTSSDSSKRATLRMRAATLVSTVCTYLDPNPIPFWEERVAARDAVIRRLTMLYGGGEAHDTAVAEAFAAHDAASAEEEMAIAFEGASSDTRPEGEEEPTVQDGTAAGAPSSPPDVDF